MYMSVSVYRHISASAEVDFWPHPDLIIWITQPLECILSYLTKSTLVTHWEGIDLLDILWMLFTKYDGDNT